MKELDSHGRNLDEQASGWINVNGGRRKSKEEGGEQVEEEREGNDSGSHFFLERVTR
jgi:hypothetical protein